MILDACADAFFDAVKMLPFLFFAFLLVEALEHKASDWIRNLMRKVNHAGPILGALLGCVPQCGFSVVTVNLYTGGVVTLGTLVAVLLSTSDEAILVLLGHPDSGGMIMRLLFYKMLIAIVAGFAVDLILRRRGREESGYAEALCTNCGCKEHEGIIRPAVYHTVRLFSFLLIFTFLLNLVIGLAGEEFLAGLLLDGSWMQPFLAAAIGLVPNCAASVLITELYLAGGISFGSAVAGLCAGAGVGLAVLFRVHPGVKSNLMILGLLYGIAVLAGLILQYFAL